MDSTLPEYIVSYRFKPVIRPVPTMPLCLHSSPAGLLQPQVLQAPSSATGMKGVHPADKVQCNHLHSLPVVRK